MTEYITTQSDASLDLKGYLKAINVVPLLTADDERRLAGKIANGDDDARARMIRANLRLVVRIARDYQNRGMAMDDLIGEGNLGLIRAAQEFDPAFGVRFSTYAGYWIKQAIRHALISTTTTIRIPAHIVGLLTKWRRAERALNRDLGRPPTFDEMADGLGLTEVQRTMMERAFAARKARLEGSLCGDEMWALADAPNRGEVPEARAELGDEMDDLRRRMGALDERGRTILEARYGLRGGEPLKLQEIGDRLGVTREWIRKLEKRAIGKLAEMDSS